jgi:hypothetical protein
MVESSLCREGRVPSRWWRSRRPRVVGLSIAAILIVLALSVLSSLRVHPGEEAWPDGRVP